MRTSVLLSIKPEFVHAILEGKKTYEFRRVIFRRENVRRIVMYASSPVQKVIGEVRLAEVLSMAPAALWAATSTSAGIPKSYFYTYFKGLEEAYALRIARPRRYKEPLDLKKHFGISRPPQSFCYLL